MSHVSIPIEESVWNPEEDNDNMSMSSANSFPDVEIRGGVGNSEDTRLLTSQNFVKIITDPGKRKAVVSAGVFLLLLIGGATFVGVYATSSSSSDFSLHHHDDDDDGVIPPPLALPYEINTVVVPEEQDEQPQGDQPQPSSSVARNNLRTGAKKNAVTSAPVTATKTEKSASPPAINGSNNVDSVSASSTAKPKSKKKRKKIQHGRKQLPADAESKPAISLLYQMKLVPNDQGHRINTVMNFTHCEDEFDGKRFFKGWKAVLKVNAALARISEDKNLFVGYGKSKKLAKEMAAQYAMMTIYPGKLTYKFEDVDWLKPYCDAAGEDEGT